MERWAANTLRTLGIILTAGVVILGSLFLLLLAMCAYQGGFGGAKHPEQVLPYTVSAVLVLFLGIWLISWLARGIHRANAAARQLSPESPASASADRYFTGPLHLSSAGSQAINRLVLAMAAQIGLSAVVWILNRMAALKTPNTGPHISELILLAPYILYHIPYAILIYVLLKRPDRRAFTYSIAVSAVIVLQSFFSLSVYSLYLAHNGGVFLPLFVPWVLHIVVLVLAYKAIQQVGLHPEPSSLIVAAIVTFIFFSSIHAISPFLYRFRPLP